MLTRWEKVHEQDPTGPGDARPTAFDIIHDENLEGQLEGKVVLITGCSSGIGVETAIALANTGATLFVAARDLQKARKALESSLNSDQITFLRLDLESLASVRACAEEFLTKSDRLNILIANAGVMACPESRTQDGFEAQIGTNHLGHFLLFNLLKKTLLESSIAMPDFDSRVVVLSSMAHRYAISSNMENINLDGIYDPLAAYSQSKLANIWMANELERRYGSKGLHAWSVDPGAVATDLGRHLSQEQIDSLQNNEDFMKRRKSLPQGAATTVWAATAKALEGQGGKYCEDCHISKEYRQGAGQWAPGYSIAAYDIEGEAKLWKNSLNLIGLEDDTRET